ncbi:MAG: ParB/RepB/Spo0J family partition protein, partial [Anaerolineae bacterium]
MNAPEAPESLGSATTAAPEFRLAPLARILKSPTNPRKRRDAAADAELAASVKAHGILQPLLVRRWQVGMALPKGACFGDMTDHFELIAGERRWGAAQAAGLAEVPVLVRDLPDDAVLELQLVENIQREDLHPLEEAEGYEALMQRHHYTVEQIADKTHRSKSAIYAALKLTELCAEARKAFYAGRLTASTALLVARIPVEKLQIEALDYIAGHEHADPTPFREAARLIQSRYMLRLAEAPFSRADTYLVPGAATCHECPKRTGNQATLFADVKNTDVCTDPDCFAAKKAAHATRQRDQAKAEGRRVIEGKAAKAIMPHAYSSELSGGYVDLDKRCYDDPKGRTVRQILGKDAPPAELLVSPHEDGKVVEVVSRESIEEQLKAKGIAPPGRPAIGRSDDEKKAEAKRRQEQAFRTRLFDKVRSAYLEAEVGGLMDLDTDDLRMIARHVLSHLAFDDGKRLARLWIGAGGGEVGDDHALIRRLKARIDDMATPEVSRLLLECCLVGQVAVSAYAMHHKPEQLLQQAEFLGIDPKAIRTELIAEQRAREKAKKAPKGKAKPKAAPKAETPRAPGEL